ncbi:MAG: deoxyribose-phosphate aldolase [Christensenellales bacterium]
MSLENILSKVDHTLLSADCTWEQIRQLCDDALLFRTASVCIPPAFVRKAAEYLSGRVKVCTVVGFPNGYSTAASKVFEARDAVAEGADEIDMVINLGKVKEGDFAYILGEIRAVKEACRGKLLKVIIEACLLTDAEKIKLCEVVTESGADFIKTSTGFSKGGATFEDVALMKANVGEGVGVKAAGGIASLEDAEKFIRLGCDRLGTSRIVSIAKNIESAGY